MIKLDVSEGKLNEELNQWFWKGLDSDKEEQNAPLFREEPIQIIAHDDRGRRIAALAGTICWDWLYIDMIWVEKDSRKKNTGSDLMRRVEQEARLRNCAGVYLWTQSFQAPGFYEKLGYEKFVVISDFPRGHQRIGFMKRLAA